MVRSSLALGGAKTDCYILRAHKQSTMPLSQIPGVKVLDEIIAGLPTNSQQRLEIAKLKEQIAVLQNENEELKAQAQSHQPKPELSADAVRILGYFFDEARPFSSDEIAVQFQLQASMAQHHLDTLHRKKKYIGIYVGRSLPFGNPPLRYEIIDGGRAFIADLRSS